MIDWFDRMNWFDRSAQTGTHRHTGFTGHKLVLLENLKKKKKKEKKGVGWGRSGRTCALGGKNDRKRAAMPRAAEIGLDASAWNNDRCTGGLTRGLRDREAAVRR